MEYKEKIKLLQEKIDRANSHIQKEMERIDNWKQTITEYENLEIRGMLKEYNVSISQLEDFLKDETPNKMDSQENPQKSDGWIDENSTT